MKHFKKNHRRYSVSFFISLAIHLSFLFYITKSNDPSQINENPKQATNPKKIIELDKVKFISQKQLQEIKNNQRKQIVANDLNGKKEKPENSRFSGQADQVYDRQTIASKNGSFKPAGLGEKNGSQSHQEIQENQQKLTDRQKHAPSKTLSLGDLGKFSINTVIEKQKKNQKSQLPMEGIQRGSQQSIGLAQNNDFIEDVPLGDASNLNTTENKYYGFYHRIRQRLEQYWGSTIQSKAKSLYKSGRRLASNENLITAITVTLDERGNILDIKIDGTSGIRELDQAAIESFNKAGPFPNPPKGLLVGGRAVIQWGFVVKG